MNPHYMEKYGIFGPQTWENRENSVKSCENHNKSNNVLFHPLWGALNLTPAVPSLPLFICAHSRPPRWLILHHGARDFQHISYLVPIHFPCNSYFGAAPMPPTPIIRENTKFSDPKSGKIKHSKENHSKIGFGGSGNSLDRQIFRFCIDCPSRNLRRLSFSPIHAQFHVFHVSINFDFL